MAWMFSSVLMTTLEGHVSWSKCNFFGREACGPFGADRRGPRRPNKPHPTPVSLFITQWDEGVLRLDLGRGGEGGRKTTPTIWSTFSTPESGALTQKRLRCFNRKLEQIAVIISISSSAPERPNICYWSVPDFRVYLQSRWFHDVKNDNPKAQIQKSIYTNTLIHKYRIRLLLYFPLAGVSAFF